MGDRWYSTTDLAPESAAAVAEGGASPLGSGISAILIKVDASDTNDMPANMSSIGEASTAGAGGEGETVEGVATGGD